MKLFAVLMFVFTCGLSASTLAQQERVDLDLREVSMERLFREIQQQTGLFFVYNEELTSGVGPVTVRAERETVESVLRRVREGTPCPLRALCGGEKGWRARRWRERHCGPAVGARGTVCPP